MEEQRPIGFEYLPNAVSSATAEMILQRLRKSGWKGVTAAAKSRRVIHYGFEYRYDRSGLRPAPPIPQILHEAASAIQARLNMPHFVFDQHIANEYTPGQGIAAHTDHPELFGGVILCVTTGSGAEIEFTRGDQVFRQFMEPLSAYLMALDARYLWKHTIKARTSDVVRGMRRPRGTRISLTWRITATRANDLSLKAADMWAREYFSKNAKPTATTTAVAATATAAAAAATAVAAEAPSWILAEAEDELWKELVGDS